MHIDQTAQLMKDLLRQ